jgi:hypothetical protein
MWRVSRIVWRKNHARIEQMMLDLGTYGHTAH